MDLDTDQRRQINRNNRNTRDKLPDRLLSALRTARMEDVHALVDAVRQDATSLELEALIDQLSSRSEDNEQISTLDVPSPSNLRESSYENGDWIQTPTDSEMPMGFDHRRSSFIADASTFPGHSDLQEMVDGDKLHFGSASGIHVSLGSSKTDRLSQVMLSFREAASTQIAGGAQGKDILSMSGLGLDLFFRDRVDSDPHTISTWACEFAKSWTSLSPVSQLAVVYFAGAFMRWYTLPCRKTYALMSTLLQPLNGESMVHDLSEIEHCRAHGADWINSLTLNAQQLSWPYTYISCLEDPIAGAGPHVRRFSKLFIEYCDDSTNWDQSDR